MDKAQTVSWARRNHVGWSSAWLLAPPALVLLAGWTLTLSTTSHSVQAAAQTSEEEIVRFTDANELIRPEGYREWIYVGTPLTPNDLNPPEAPFPEFHSVYIDPSSYEHYRDTGEFPDGTVLVKELASVGSTRAVSGAGYFMGEFIGLEATVKSAERFPDEPGHWAYFSFGHAYPLAATAEAFPTAACNSCHAAAAADDFVFTQYYPVLRSATSVEAVAQDASQALTRESAFYADLATTMSRRTAAAVQPSAETQPVSTVVPMEGQALFAYLQSGAYQSFEARETESHPSRGPHSKFGLPVRVFLDPTLDASLRDGQDVHPVGATAIKEMYDDEGTLEGWAVMVKHGADSDGGAGWFWYETTDTEDWTNTVAAGSGVPLCFGCHAGGTDFVLTGYPLK